MTSENASMNRDDVHARQSPVQRKMLIPHGFRHPDSGRIWTLAEYWITQGGRSDVGRLVSELGVLGFGLSVNRKIAVGVFPNGKEFFVGFAGGSVIAHESLCPTELKPGQWASDICPGQTRIVNQLLE